MKPGGYYRRIFPSHNNPIQQFCQSFIKTILQQITDNLCTLVQTGFITLNHIMLTKHMDSESPNIIKITQYPPLLAFIPSCQNLGNNPMFTEHVIGSGVLINTSLSSQIIAFKQVAT